LLPKKFNQEIENVKDLREIIRLLEEAKPELARRHGIQRLAVFGSYARGDQREESDVDILIEVDPSIGLRFVDLADEIETKLGLRAEVVSRRAIKPRNWEVIEKDLIDVP
jgi:predicted nucleotidyltransferase